MKLEGKVAIVTGGAQGIGRGIVRCLAEEGADVVIADIDMDNATKAAEEVKSFGRRALVVEADITQKEKPEQVVKSTLDTFGKIDILVNNVGGVRTQDIVTRALAPGEVPRMTDLPEEFWDDTYELNFKSQVLMSKAVVPHMKAQKSGKIINIASIAGKNVNAGGGHAGEGGAMLMPYSAMKGSVIGFTRTLAREVAMDNINVNCICPGFIYSPAMQRGTEQSWQTNPAYRELKEPKDIFLLTVAALIPMGREQTAEDIGHMAAFFASEDARNITGQTICVDGGIVMD